MELVVIGVLIILLAVVFLIIQMMSKKNCQNKTLAKIIEVKQEQYFKKDINSNNTSVSFAFRPVYEFLVNGNKVHVADSKGYKYKGYLKKLGKYVSLYYNSTDYDQIYVSDSVLNIIIASAISIGTIVVTLGVLMIFAII